MLLGISSEDRRGRGAAGRRRGGGGGEIEFWKLNCKQRNVDVKTLQLHLFEENKSLNQSICTEGFLVLASLSSSATSSNTSASVAKAAANLSLGGGVIVADKRLHLHALELRHQLPEAVIRVQRELATGEGYL